VLLGPYSLPGTPQLRSKAFRLSQEGKERRLVCMKRDKVRRGNR